MESKCSSTANKEDSRIITHVSKKLDNSGFTFESHRGIVPKSLQSWFAFPKMFARLPVGATIYIDHGFTVAVCEKGGWIGVCEESKWTIDGKDYTNDWQESIRPYLHNGKHYKANKS